MASVVNSTNYLKNQQPFPQTLPKVCKGKNTPQFILWGQFYQNQTKSSQEKPKTNISYKFRCKNLQYDINTHTLEFMVCYKRSTTMRSLTPKLENRPRSSQLETALHQQRPSTAKNKYIIFLKNKGLKLHDYLNKCRKTIANGNNGYTYGIDGDGFTGIYLQVHPVIYIK